MIRGLVFDIDDTLYPERDYVRSGFAHVARTTGRSREEVEAYWDWLRAAFEAGVRGDTFDRFRAAFPDVAARFSTDELIESYRTHRPSIALWPGVEQVLDEAGRRGIRLGVLSDGPATSQAAKARALRLDRWFDPIVLTGTLGPAFAKPAVAGFERISSGWRIPGPELAYVADNPAKDFTGPRRLGWLTIRLRRPDQLRFDVEATDDAAAPDVTILSIEDVLGHLPSPR